MTQLCLRSDTQTEAELFAEFTKRVEAVLVMQAHPTGRSRTYLQRLAVAFKNVQQVRDAQKFSNAILQVKEL